MSQAMSPNVPIPIRGSVRPAPARFGACPRRGDWRLEVVKRESLEFPLPQRPSPSSGSTTGLLVRQNATQAPSNQGRRSPGRPDGPVSTGGLPNPSRHSWVSTASLGRGDQPHRRSSAPASKRGPAAGSHPGPRRDFHFLRWKGTSSLCALWPDRPPGPGSDRPARGWRPAGIPGGGGGGAECHRFGISLLLLPSLSSGRLR